MYRLDLVKKIQTASLTLSLYYVIFSFYPPPSKLQTRGKDLKYVQRSNIQRSMNLISQKCTLYWFFMNILPSTLFILEKIKDKKKRVIQVQTLMESERKKNFCSTKLASIHAITHSLYIFSRNTVSHNFISKFLFLYITCQFFRFISLLWLPDT